MEQIEFFSSKFRAFFDLGPPLRSSQMICRTVKIIPDYQYFLVFSKMLLMQKIFGTKDVILLKENSARLGSVLKV